MRPIYVASGSEDGILGAYTSSGKAARRAVGYVRAAYLRGEEDGPTPRILTRSDYDPIATPKAVARRLRERGIVMIHNGASGRITATLETFDADEEV